LCGGALNRVSALVLAATSILTSFGGIPPGAVRVNLVTMGQHLKLAQQFIGEQRQQHPIEWARLAGLGCARRRDGFQM
jgi:hypothetical protein